MRFYLVLLVFVCITLSCATGGRTVYGNATGGTVIVGSMDKELEAIFEGLASTLKSGVFSDAVDQLSSSNTVSQEAYDLLEELSKDQSQKKSVRDDCLEALSIINS